MKNRYILLTATLTMLLLIAAGCVVLTYLYPSSGPTKSSPLSSTKAPTATPSPAPDAFTIDGLRARDYQGGPIATERDLGGQSGYRNSVVSYQSDGLKIYALMSVPNGPKPAGGWPVIIFNHGYINPANYQTNGSEYREFIATFARAGYVVIKPDYRGHGQSQGAPEGGHFSVDYAIDELNLIASIKQDADLNAGRIGLFGHSMGGHVALRTIVVSKDVKATVLMAGVVGSFEDIFYNWPHSPVTTDLPAVVQTMRQNLIAKYGTPKTNPDFWNKASAIHYVRDVTGAVQINQDADDSVVPKIFADHLNTVMTAAHKPVEYYVYPGDDHQFIQNRALLLQRAVAFYKAHL